MAEIRKSRSEFRVGAEVNDPTYGPGRVVRLIAAGSIVASAVVVFYKLSKEYEFVPGGVFDLNRLELISPVDAIARTANSVVQTVGSIAKGESKPGAVLPKETYTWRQLISQLQGQRFRENGQLYNIVQKRLTSAISILEGSKALPRLESITTPELLMDVLTPMFPEVWAKDIILKALHGKKKLPIGFQVVDIPGSSQINKDLYGKNALRLSANPNRREETIKLRKYANEKFGVGKQQEAPTAFATPRVGGKVVVESPARPINQNIKVDPESWFDVIQDLHKRAHGNEKHGNINRATELRDYAKKLTDMHNAGTLPDINGSSEDIYKVLTKNLVVDPLSESRAKYSRLSGVMEETGMNRVMYSLPEKHRLIYEQQPGVTSRPHTMVFSDKMHDGTDVFGDKVRSPETVADVLVLWRNKKLPAVDVNGNVQYMRDAEGNVLDRQMWSVDPETMQLVDNIASHIKDPSRRITGPEDFFAEVGRHIPGFDSKSTEELRAIGRTIGWGAIPRRNVNNYMKVLPSLFDHTDLKQPETVWDMIVRLEAATNPFEKGKVPNNIFKATEEKSIRLKDAGSLLRRLVGTDPNANTNQSITSVLDNMFSGTGHYAELGAYYKDLGTYNKSGLYLGKDIENRRFEQTISNMTRYAHASTDAFRVLSEKTDLSQRELSELNRIKTVRTILKTKALDTNRDVDIYSILSAYTTTDMDDKESTKLVEMNMFVQNEYRKNWSELQDTFASGPKTQLLDHEDIRQSIKGDILEESKRILRLYSKGEMITDKQAEDFAYNVFNMRVNNTYAQDWLVDGSVYDDEFDGIIKQFNHDMLNNIVSGQYKPIGENYYSKWPEDADPEWLEDVSKYNTDYLNELESAEHVEMFNINRNRKSMRITNEKSYKQLVEGVVKRVDEIYASGVAPTEINENHASDKEYNEITKTLTKENIKLNQLKVQKRSLEKTVTDDDYKKEQQLADTEKEAVKLSINNELSEKNKEYNALSKELSTLTKRKTLTGTKRKTEIENKLESIGKEIGTLTDKLSNIDKQYKPKKSPKFKQIDNLTEQIANKENEIQALERRKENIARVSKKSDKIVMSEEDVQKSLQVKFSRIAQEYGDTEDAEHGKDIYRKLKELSGNDELTLTEKIEQANKIIEPGIIRSETLLKYEDERGGENSLFGYWEDSADFSKNKALPKISIADNLITKYNSEIVSRTKDIVKLNKDLDNEKISETEKTSIRKEITEHEAEIKKLKFKITEIHSESRLWTDTNDPHETGIDPFEILNIENESTLGGKAATKKVANADDVTAARLAEFNEAARSEERVMARMARTYISELTVSERTMLGIKGEIGLPHISESTYEQITEAGKTTRTLSNMPHYDPYAHFLTAATEGKLDNEEKLIAQFGRLKAHHENFMESNSSRNTIFDQIEKEFTRRTTTVTNPKDSKWWSILKDHLTTDTVGANGNTIRTGDPSWGLATSEEDMKFRIKSLRNTLSTYGVNAKGNEIVSKIKPQTIAVTKIKSIELATSVGEIEAMIQNLENNKTGRTIVAEDTAKTTTFKKTQVSVDSVLKTAGIVTTEYAENIDENIKIGSANRKSSSTLHSIASDIFAKVQKVKPGTQFELDDIKSEVLIEATDFTNTAIAKAKKKGDLPYNPEQHFADLLKTHLREQNTHAKIMRNALGLSSGSIENFVNLESLDEAAFEAGESETSLTIESMVGDVNKLSRKEIDMQSHIITENEQQLIEKMVKHKLTGFIKKVNNEEFNSATYVADTLFLNTNDPNNPTGAKKKAAFTEQVEISSPADYTAIVGNRQIETNRRKTGKTLVEANGISTYLQEDGTVTGQNAFQRLQDARSGKSAIVLDTEYFRNEVYQIGSHKYDFRTGNRQNQESQLIEISEDSAELMRKFLVGEDTGITVRELSYLRKGIESTIQMANKAITASGIVGKNRFGINSYDNRSVNNALMLMSGQLHKLNLTTAAELEAVEKLKPIKLTTFLENNVFGKADYVMNQNIDSADLNVMVATLEAQNAKKDVIAKVNDLRNISIDTLDAKYAATGIHAGLSKYDSNQTHEGLEDTFIVTKQEKTIPKSADFSQTSGHLFVDKVTGHIYKPDGEMEEVQYVEHGTRGVKYEQKFNRINDDHGYEVRRTLENLTVSGPTESFLAAHRINAKFIRFAEADLELAKKASENIIIDKANRRAGAQLARKTDAANDLQYVHSDLRATEMLKNIDSLPLDRLSENIAVRDAYGLKYAIEPGSDIAKSVTNLYHNKTELWSLTNADNSALETSLAEVQRSLDYFARSSKNAENHQIEIDELGQQKIYLTAEMHRRTRELNEQLSLRRSNRDTSYNDPGSFENRVLENLHSNNSIQLDKSILSDEKYRRIEELEKLIGLGEQNKRVIEALNETSHINSEYAMEVEKAGLKRAELALNPPKSTTDGRTNIQSQLLLNDEKIYSNNDSIYNNGMKDVLDNLKQGIESSNISKEDATRVYRNYLTELRNAGVIEPKKDLRKNLMDNVTKITASEDFELGGNDYTLKSLKVGTKEAFETSLHEAMLQVNDTRKDTIENTTKLITDIINKKYGDTEKMRESLLNANVNITDFRSYTVTDKASLDTLAEITRKYTGQFTKEQLGSSIEDNEIKSDSFKQLPYNVVTTQQPQINTVLPQTDVSNIADIKSKLIPETLDAVHLAAQQESVSLNVGRMENNIRAIAEGSEGMASKFGTAGIAISALALGAMMLNRPGINTDERVEEKKEHNHSIPMHRILAYPIEMAKTFDHYAEKMDIVIRGTVKKESDPGIIANLTHMAIRNVAKSVLGMDIDHKDKRENPNKHWARGLGENL